MMRFDHAISNGFGLSFEILGGLANLFNHKESQSTLKGSQRKTWQINSYLVHAKPSFDERKGGEKICLSS